MDTQFTLADKLAKFTTDKERVKLLLKTLHKYGTGNDLNSLGIRSFCVGYLGSLLIQYGLNDFEDEKE